MEPARESTELGFPQVLEAASRIAPYVHRTPVLTCKSLDRMYGARLFFKCENLQKVGAFKIRGATNAVFSLEENKASRGVATHSSGNHAAALAQAAAWRGIPCEVVMPRNAPEVKKRAVAGYRARITFCEPTLEARERALEELVRASGATFIHPYNDPRVIAGQGTAALELLEEVPELEAVMVPVGGGGLLSGTALAISARSPRTMVLAGEPERADDAIRSLREGRILPPQNPDTVADGLRTCLGTLTFPIIQKLVHAIFPVSEEAILEAMRDIWERMKLVVEPSGAVPLAAVKASGGLLEGKRVGIILSGGNVDLDRLPFRPAATW
jgi:threonine dehydratase